MFLYKIDGSNLEEISNKNCSSFLQGSDPLQRLEVKRTIFVANK